MTNKALIRSIRVMQNACKWLWLLIKRGLIECYHFGPMLPAQHFGLWHIIMMHI